MWALLGFSKFIFLALYPFHPDLLFSGRELNLSLSRTKCDSPHPPAVLHPEPRTLPLVPVLAPCLPSSASVRLEPGSLPVRGSLATWFLMRLGNRGSGGRKDVPMSPVLSRGPQDGHLPPCPSSPRTSGFLTSSIWLFFSVNNLGPGLNLSSSSWFGCSS